jgi:hypothetical protein
MYMTASAGSIFPGLLVGFAEYIVYFPFFNTLSQYYHSKQSTYCHQHPVCRDSSSEAATTTQPS